MKRIVERTADPLSAIVGIPYGTLLFLWLGITVLFAVIYFTLASFPGLGPSELEHLPPFARFLDALYFSVILGTTTGLGDIAPDGLSKLFASLQSIMSFILLAAFVAKFASRQQDIVIEDIHTISFDSSFHSIRNGLFIARKDIDVLIKKVLSVGELDAKDWANFRTALRQMQIFIKLIPGFYRKTHVENVIDVDREMLLLDSLERTLTRLVEALELLKSRGISVVGHENASRELDSLVSLVERVSLHEEFKAMDPENLESLQEIFKTAEGIRMYLE